MNDITDEDIKSQASHFVHNGIKIISIKRITKNLEVFNLQCEPYDNYITIGNYTRKNVKGGYRGVLVHNCEMYGRCWSEDFLDSRRSTHKD